MLRGRNLPILALPVVAGLGVGGLTHAIATEEGPSPPWEKVLAERSLDHLEPIRCHSMMRSLIAQSRNGAQIVWLWTDETVPGVVPTAQWTRHPMYLTGTPSPLAFHPATQSAPTGACSFPNNSLHVVEVVPSSGAETRQFADLFASGPAPR